MEELSYAWRKIDAPADPSTDGGYWVHTLKTVFEELEALGLSNPVPKPEPKKRGRKPKPKNQTELILPYHSDDFHTLKTMSHQQARFVLGDFVHQQIFLTSF